MTSTGEAGCKEDVVVGQHPAVIQAIVDLTPIQDAEILSAIGSDVFRRLLVFLNRIEFQDSVQSHADALTKAMVQLLT